jgi:hypothetical protein
MSESIEDCLSGGYGENPDPKFERYERFLVERMSSGNVSKEIKHNLIEVLDIVNNPIPGGGWNPSLIKGRLKKLRALGVPVENYGGKNGQDLIRYYMALSKDLRSI